MTCWWTHRAPHSTGADRVQCWQQPVSLLCQLPPLLRLVGQQVTAGHGAVLPLLPLTQPHSCTSVSGSEKWEQMYLLATSYLSFTGASSIMSQGCLASR